MGSIKDSLTFDDVSLVPQESSVVPNETITKITLHKRLNLQIPLISSAMDTVTESKMAIAIAKMGGIGVIHRNLSADAQVSEIRKVKKAKFLVGAAIGVNNNDLDRVKKLIEANVDMIVIDTAHGHTQKVSKMIYKVKKIAKKIPLCAGNIATGKAAKFLASCGVDIVKVGIGPGSICTTRLVAGVGVPQLSAILDVKKALGKSKTKIISDGGIKFSGDLAKAIAAGADAVMIGSPIAKSSNAPGKGFHWGMATPSPVLPRGTRIEVGSTGSLERIIKGPALLDDGTHNLLGAIRTSMSTLGAKNIKEMQEVEIVIAPSLLTEGKVYLKAQQLGMGK